MIGRIVIVLLGFWAWSSSASAQSQYERYCAFGSRVSLLLVDRTTQYDDADRRVIIGSASAAIDHLQVGERIVVRTIEAHYSTSRAVFNGCMPGCPSSNPIDELRNNCSANRARGDRLAFRREILSAVLPYTRNEREAANSDITGTIAQLSRHPPGGRRYNHVIIFSDMLENSQALPWSAFRSNSVAVSMDAVRRYERLPVLRGAEVRIVGFGRLHDAARSPLNAEMDTRIREFWRSYFAEGGARSATFEQTIE